MADNDVKNPNSSLAADIKVAPENVIILHVDNLLSGWPTYVIRYLPDQPGPVKIILRLKDIKKNAVSTDDNLDSDEEQQPTTKKPKIDPTPDPSHARVTVVLDPSVKLRSEADTQWDEISEVSDSESESSVKSSAIDAIPVALHGILKDPPPIKRINFANDRTEYWPPHRSRPYKEVTNERATDAHTHLWAFPVPVRGKEALCEKENAL